MGALIMYGFVIVVAITSVIYFKIQERNDESDRRYILLYYQCCKL